MHWISDVDVDADAHVHRGQCVVELDADARVLVLVTDDLGRHRGDVQREAVRHVDARDAPDLRLDVRTVVVEIERQEVRVAGGSTSVKRGQEHSTLEHERIAIIKGKACAGSPPARRAPRVARSPVPLHGRSTAGRRTARRRTHCGIGGMHRPDCFLDRHFYGAGILVGLRTHGAAFPVSASRRNSMPTADAYREAVAKASRFGASRSTTFCQSQAMPSCCSWSARREST